MSETGPVAAYLRCACGWETTGPLDDVVAATDEHGPRVHNMAATREEILARVETVVDVPADQRYELRLGDELAGVAEYREIGGRRVFHHTEVDEKYEGRGMGSRLARAVLDDVRARGIPVRLKCPFLRAWVARHPDYADLVGLPDQRPAAGS
jgi:predicted GNAT family acetyltransferase